VPNLTGPAQQISQRDDVAKQEQGDDPHDRSPANRLHQPQPDGDKQQTHSQVDQGHDAPGIGDDVAQSSQDMAVVAGDQNRGRQQAEQDSADNDGDTQHGDFRGNEQGIPTRPHQRR